MILRRIPSVELGIAIPYTISPYLGVYGHSYKSSTLNHSA